MTKADQAKFDAIESEVRTLRADNAQMVRDLAEVRSQRDLFKSNSLRKEGVIQALQRKLEGKGDKPVREPSEMRRKLDAAKAEAMASGRVVTV